VQNVQHSSDVSDDEWVYYDAEDEQPGVNFMTQPKLGKTPPKRDAKQTPAGAYPEAPKICFSKFWVGKCTRGNNCAFHGPDSYKLEREARTKYTEILDIYIVHGREARRPTDQWMEDFVDQLHNMPVVEYILELQQVMLEAWKVAADKKFQAQENIQRRQQPTQSIHQVQPGDYHSLYLTR
jgi:hypothetical protein